MKIASDRFARVTLLLATGVLMMATTLGSASAADPEPDRAAARAQHRQEWVRARLERSANRLEIKPSQQAAWQEYAAARTALAQRDRGRPAQDLDAAALVKFQADRAADKARRLAVLADATAKLQVVLTPEQRDTLRQMMHHQRHRRDGAWDGARGHHEWRGGPDGQRGVDRHREGPAHTSETEQSDAAPAV